MDEIPQQTKLPLNVALDIVMQGIRIRLGRSLVTVSGVVLGVAFLMSILTGILLKQGVSEEDALRRELDRKINFLEAESGVIAGKNLGIIVVGEISKTESRFIEALLREDVARIRYFDPEGLLTSVERDRFEASDLDQVGDGASAVLLMGDLQAGRTVFPDGVQPENILSGARQALFATTHAGIPLPEGPGITSTQLSRELKPSEIEARKVQARRDRFRDIWIIVISLLVTVIGIANAMLMSVTERFREIGTMKCLGALSAFVRRMFLIESAIMGLSGGIVGSLGGVLFSLLAYVFTYGPSLVLAGLRTHFFGMVGFGLLAIIAGVVLSMIAALYPANVAARMVPAVALRSNV